MIKTIIVSALFSAISVTAQGKNFEMVEYEVGVAAKGDVLKLIHDKKRNVYCYIYAPTTLIPKGGTGDQLQAYEGNNVGMISCVKMN